MRNALRLGMWVCACGLMLAGAAQGAVIVNIGDILLNRNQANQAVPINVSGGSALQGVSLEVQIGDGTNSALLPKIVSVDIITGTIFQGNNTGQGGSGFAFATPTFYEATTTTSTGTVLANGLLATVYIDTTGFQGGNWPLKLTGTRNGDTDFIVSSQIVNGTVQVPEPGTAALLLAAAPLLMRRRRVA